MTTPRTDFGARVVLGALAAVVLQTAIMASAAQALMPAKVKALIRTEERLNDTCRGGSGDSPATMRACDARDKYVKELESLGWCYGKPDQIEADRKWQKCAHSSSTHPK